MAADQIQKRAADAEQLAADWRACEKAAAAFDEETNTGGDGAAAEEHALRNVDAKRVAALAELADRPALSGSAAAGAIQRRKRRLADRAAGQMLFALALRDDDDGPDAGAVVPVSRRRAPFCWRKRDVAAAPRGSALTAVLLQRSFSEGVHGRAGSGTAQAANRDVNASPYAVAALASAVLRPWLGPGPVLLVCYRPLALRGGAKKWPCALDRSRCGLRL